MPSEYPLLADGRADLPAEESADCPVCGNPLGTTTVTLAAGAMAWDRASKGYGPAKTMRGFLNLRWNEDRPEDKDSKYLVAYLSIVESVHGGQFSITACSFQCLHSLFAGWVDELEKRAGDEMAALARLKAAQSGDK
jgi:hypothetical protein